MTHTFRVLTLPNEYATRPFYVALRTNVTLLSMEHGLCEGGW